MRTSDLPRSGDLTIAIATVNSARYIDIILRYYREHGLAVMLFVDDRSVDDSLAKARELAPEAISTSNPGGFIAEDLIEKMSRACPTKWLLRIDDDKLPSLSMMDFVRNAVRNDTPDVYAFPRQRCAVSRKGALLRHGEVRRSTTGNGVFTSRPGSNSRAGCIRRALSGRSKPGP